MKVAWWESYWAECWVFWKVGTMAENWAGARADSTDALMAVTMAVLTVEHSVAQKAAEKVAR